MSQPSGQCPLSFPNAQLEMSHRKESTGKISCSHFCRVLSDPFQLVFLLYSPAFSHSVLLCLSFLLTCLTSIYSCNIFPLCSSFFSTTISPCQQCQLGPCGAEKIEPQIEQSISVRIHQCQTTPSLVVCNEHTHMHSYF